MQLTIIKRLAFLLILEALEVYGALELTVAANGGNVTSPVMYGILYEDIFHSGDGGMYSELIRNRAFQGSNANGQASTVRNLAYWHKVGGATLALDNSSPAVSTALPYHMRVDIPSGTTGAVGFWNEGFWGMNITTQTRYAANFYLRGAYAGSIVCSFYSNTTGALLGSTTIAVSQTVANGWKLYTSTFTPSSSAPDGKNTFRLTFDSSTTAGQSLYFNMISVFQQTFKDRNNGLRMDLSNALNSMGVKYLRMPGGNNMQGQSPPFRWKWNETVGPIIKRPGRPGVWGDINTDGLGLLEQMQWGIDMGLKIILGVWAGLYLDGTVISQANLQPYITDVLNELEFLTGSTSTIYGALRASYGYPNPFTVDYIEIGNEDYLNGGTSSYGGYRFKMFHDQIKAKYPAARIISTISISSISNAPSGIFQDDHNYPSSTTMVSQFNAYDHASRSRPIFIAEYAAITIPGVSGQINNPTLASATAEAVFLLGLERNADIVTGSSYGALIKNLNEDPNNVAVIKHNADSVVLSLSYYVQKLFATHFGTHTLPVSSSSNYGPLYWGATVADDGTRFVKIVNNNGVASTPVKVTCQGSGKTSAVLKQLTAPSAGSANTLGNTVSVWTETTVGASSPGVFDVTLSGAYVVAVLVV